MKLRIFLSLLLVVAIFSACKKGDGDQDYGFPYIYMPQSTLSGGLDNYYTVPSGGGEYTYNFKIENGKLNIILGVLHSGKLPDAAYSVTVSGTEPSASVLAAVGGIAMPSSLYTLPQKVDVSGDKSGETFYLSVDAAALASETYSGQKLVLTVGISNPSKFELAETGTSVVVIVDVDKVKKFF